MLPAPIKAATPTIGAALVARCCCGPRSRRSSSPWLAWFALVPVAVAAALAPTARLARAAVPLAYAIYLELLLVPALPFGIAEDQWGDPPVPLLIGDSPVLGGRADRGAAVRPGAVRLRFPRPWPPAPGSAHGGARLDRRAGPHMDGARLRAREARPGRAVGAAVRLAARRVRPRAMPRWPDRGS